MIVHFSGHNAELGLENDPVAAHAGFLKGFGEADFAGVLGPAVNIGMIKIVDAEFKAGFEETDRLCFIQLLHAHAAQCQSRHLQGRAAKENSFHGSGSFQFLSAAQSSIERAGENRKSHADTRTPGKRTASRGVAAFAGQWTML